MMKDTQKDETTPDELMEDFRGRSLKSIIVFTIVVHAALILGTSIPFLIKTVMGGNTEGMSEEERMKSAVRDATATLGEIAKEHGLNVEDITSQFSGGVRAPRTSVAEGTEAPVPPEGGAEVPEGPKSPIEKEIDVKEKGPALPEIKDEEEDLFK